MTALTKVNGFTDFSGGIDGTPQYGFLSGAPASGNTMYVYVSTSGNDTTGNGSVATPYLTIAKGYTRLRSGEADRLLLKCGDTFFEQNFSDSVSGTFTKYGKSEAKPMVVGSYTNTDFTSCNPGYPAVRPLVQCGLFTFDGTQYSGFYTSGGTLTSGMNHLFVTGIEFEGYYNNPNRAAWLGAAQTLVSADNTTDTIVLPSSTQTTFLITYDTHIGVVFQGVDLPLGITAVDTNSGSPVYFLQNTSGNTFRIVNIENYGPNSQSTCRTVSGSAFVTEDTSTLFIENGNIAAGMAVSGTGITGGSTISSVNVGPSLTSVATTSGSPVVACNDTTDVRVGMLIGRHGFIPATLTIGWRVISIGDATHFTLDNNAAGNITGSTLSMFSGFTASAAAASTQASTQLTFTVTSANAVTFSDNGTGTQTCIIMTREASSGGVSMTSSNPVESLHVEDCKSQYFQNGLCLDFGTTSGNHGENVGAHRNVLRFNYGGGAHSYGVLVNATFTDNFLDANGWSADQPIYPNKRASNSLRHNYYFSATPGGDTILGPGEEDFSGNISIREGQNGGQNRPGGTLRNNLYVDAAAVNFYGMVDGDVTGTHHQFSYNVITEVTGGIDFGSSVDSTVFTNGRVAFTGNIFTKGSLSNGGTAYDLARDASPNAVCVVTGTNNITWGWTTEKTALNSPGTLSWDGSNKSSPTRDIVAFPPAVFPHPERTFRSYCENVLGLTCSSTTDAIQQFTNLAALQQKGNWNGLLMAESVNDYFRQGFGQAMLGSSYAGFTGLPPQVLMPQICM